MAQPSLLASLKPWGILWNFEGFLGCSHREGEPAYVACFQIKGINKYRRPIKIQNVRIVSDLTEKEIPARIRTTSGYVDPIDANPIPRNAEFRIQGLFYDPKTPEYPREGMPEDKFMQEFGEFRFEAQYSGVSFVKWFNKFQVEAQINCVKPSQEPPPRVTRRD